MFRSLCAKGAIMTNLWLDHALFAQETNPDKKKEVTSFNFKDRESFRRFQARMARHFYAIRYDLGKMSFKIVL